MVQVTFVEQSKHTFCIQCIFSKNNAIYKTLWENLVAAPDSAHMTVYFCVEKMHFACRIIKSGIDTHVICSTYSLVIDSFRLIS